MQVSSFTGSDRQMLHCVEKFLPQKFASGDMRKRIFPSRLPFLRPIRFQYGMEASSVRLALRLNSQVGRFFFRPHFEGTSVGQTPIFDVDHRR